MKILVTGSRHRPIIDVQNVLDRYADAVSEIIVGDATGADEAAREWAHNNSVKCSEFKADWKTDGKAAGPLRNQRMVDYGADLCLAFPMDGSRGTWDCVNRARKAGVTVTIILVGEEMQARPVADETVAAMPTDAKMLKETMERLVNKYKPALIELSER